MERLRVKSAEDTELARFLHSRVVGQNEAVASVCSQYDKLLAGMADPSRPISTVLFLGPTGVGKTRLVEAFTEYLFGEGQKPLSVNCGEYAHDHQVAKLIGSPAGYMGSNEEPYFSSRRVEERMTKDGKKMNVLLFDEIEKAGSAAGQTGHGGALNNLLLSVLDRAELSLSSGKRVDFSRTMIFMTSNLGAKEILESKDQGERTRVAEHAARQFFSPEQFNRLDELVVFAALREEEITLIADLEVAEVAARSKMEIELADEVRDGLVRAGYDVRYGARHLKRAVDKWVTRPLSSLVARGQLGKGSRVRLGLEEGNVLAFFKLEGQAQLEQERTVAPPAVAPKEIEYRRTGFIKTMLERKFPAWTSSHGALIFRLMKKEGFKPMSVEYVVSKLVAEGFKTDNSGGPHAALKYVLDDWYKKNWASRTGDIYKLND